MLLLLLCLVSSSVIFSSAVVNDAEVFKLELSTSEVFVVLLVRNAKGDSEDDTVSIKEKPDTVCVFFIFWVLDFLLVVVGCLEEGSAFFLFLFVLLSKGDESEGEDEFWLPIFSVLKKKNQKM